MNVASIHMARHLPSSVVARRGHEGKVSVEYNDWKVADPFGFSRGLTSIRNDIVQSCWTRPIFSPIDKESRTTYVVAACSFNTRVVGVYSAWGRHLLTRHFQESAIRDLKNGVVGLRRRASNKSPFTLLVRSTARSKGYPQYTNRLDACLCEMGK